MRIDDRHFAVRPALSVTYPSRPVANVPNSVTEPLRSATDVPHFVAIALLSIAMAHCFWVTASLPIFPTLPLFTAAPVTAMPSLVTTMPPSGTTLAAPSLRPIHTVPQQHVLHAVAIGYSGD